MRNSSVGEGEGSWEPGLLLFNASGSASPHLRACPPADHKHRRDTGRVDVTQTSIFASLSISFGLPTSSLLCTYTNMVAYDNNYQLGERWTHSGPHKLISMAHADQMFGVLLTYLLTYLLNVAVYLTYVTLGNSQTNQQAIIVTNKQPK